MSTEAALQANREKLLAVQGVVGVGLGMQDGEKVIIVMTERPATEMQARLPPQVAGSRVVIQETGPIRAY